MKVRRSIIIGGFLAAAFGLSAAVGEDPNLSAGLRSIDPHDVYDLCKTISGPEFAGRLTGHEGYTAAAEWAAGQFEKWGLHPLGEQEGYLQAYPSPYVIVHSAEMTLITRSSKGAGENETKLRPGQDFLPLLFTDSGVSTADLVFAGWGISAPELGYDDYQGLDIRGRFVVCFRGTPDPSDNRYVDHDHHRQRMLTAKDKGALGLFYIYPEPQANPNGDWIEGFTPAIISDKTADIILAEKGLTAADLKKDLQSTKKPHSFALSSSIRFKVESTPDPQGIGYNVVGYVEGSDEALRKECVIYGAHFDHCGLHMGMLFPGADDNASGSAMVMEVARAFAALPDKPKRSVVFVLFGGEEMGLEGSSYFAGHMPEAFSRGSLMLNFDMVGEGDGAWGGYSADPPELKALLDEADKAVGILRGSRAIRGVGVRSSDFAPFFLQGIPCVMLGSNGPHLAYHLPGDTIYRINPDIMADIGRLAFITGYKWADR